MAASCLYFFRKTCMARTLCTEFPPYPRVLPHLYGGSGEFTAWLGFPFMAGLRRESPAFCHPMCCGSGGCWLEEASKAALTGPRLTPPFLAACHCCAAAGWDLLQRKRKRQKLCTEENKLHNIYMVVAWEPGRDLLFTATALHF